MRFYAAFYFSMFLSKTLTLLLCYYIIYTEKARPIAVMPKKVLFYKIALTLVSGGYFAFSANTIRIIITKIKILIMYFFIATTSFRRVA